MQNLYERVMGLRPFKERQGTERCPKDLWKRNCPAEWGYMTGRNAK